MRRDIAGSSVFGWVAGMAVAAMVMLTTGTARAASTTLVISEIQTGEKGNTTSKFIEIHNLTEERIDISNYTVVYRTATGTSNSLVYTAPEGTSIPPRGYFLLVSAGYQALHPFQAFNGTITNRTLGNTGGGIALFPGEPPDDGETGRIDAVGYGSANNGFVEGTAAPAPGSAATQSLERKPPAESSQDTDNNFADFVVTTQPTPTATETGAQAPVVSGVVFSPTSALPGATVTLTANVTPRTDPVFTVTAELSAIGLSDQTPLTSTGGLEYSVTFTIPSDAVPGRYTIPVTARDTEGAAGSASQALGIQTDTAPVTALEARNAPYNAAVKVRAIVTAISTGYAYVEDPDGTGGVIITDGTPITGVAPLQLGDDVTVNGVRQNITNESCLLITGPDDIVVNSMGNVLPTPHIVTAADVGPNTADPELYQGQLVTIKGLTITTAPDPLAFIGTTYAVATDETGSVSVFLNLNNTRFATQPYPGVPLNPIPAVTSESGAISFPEIQVGNVYNVTGPLGRRSGNVGSGPFEVIRPRDADDLILVTPSPNVPGDINRSGSVTMEDVALALKVAAGLYGGSGPSVGVANGDVFPKGSPDGVVSLGDAVRILRAIEGLETLP